MITTQRFATLHVAVQHGLSLPLAIHCFVYVRAYTFTSPSESEALLPLLRPTQ